MRRKATLYNITCPAITQQLTARGYADFDIRNIQVEMEVDVGPIEYVEPQYQWVPWIINVILVLYLFTTRNSRR